MEKTVRNIILALTLLFCFNGKVQAQRRIKMKVIVQDNKQVLKLKLRCKKGDLASFSDNFKWTLNRFDTANVIAPNEIYLPEFHSSALYFMNDSSAYFYEYDERSGGIDSSQYAKVLDLTEGYSFYEFLSGNKKRVYKYEIPIWINPNILNSNPSKAAFYLRVKFDQNEKIKEEIIFDSCRIIYR
jgi:hypothetical protein